jgi:hypothetical protein
MYFLYKYEYETLKSVEVILRKGRRKRKNNGGDEPNGGALYAYKEISQKTFLYNHHISVKNKI